MTVDFKCGVFLDIVLYKCCNVMVKMINLAAVGAFHMKMTFAFFVVDKLVNKASAVAFYGAVNKTVFNELCHKSVSRALAYFVSVHAAYYFFNSKCLIAV